MLTENQKAYILLSKLELSYKKCTDILECFNSPSDFLYAIQNGDNNLKSLFGKDYEKYKQICQDFSFDTFEEYMSKNNVNIVTMTDSNYPKNLLRLDQPPYILYYQGNLDLINTKCIAIVGTRTPSFYGKDITLKFAKELTQAGLTIVSGLSTGVDKISHETALKYGGNTIAVLGNGFLKMYPACNINLSKEIAQKGLLITEYYPTFVARNYSFPARNRIIAALSQGVLITEAAQKSGSLYTKDFALDMGIDVYSVPGNITSQNSIGTNNIIKFGHAACVTCSQDILTNYGITQKEIKEEKIQLNFEEQKIYNYLLLGEKNFDDLQQFSGFSAQNLNTCLTTMQIRGIIKKLPGNYYSV